MTDDQILILADTVCTRREYLRSMSDQDLIQFAQAVAQRTLTNQKAKWYQEGVEAEREACAKLCESLRPSEQRFSIRFWDGCTLCAVTIRARGEK